MIIKTKESKVPSDFVRTEYIEYNRKFKIKINKFVDKLFGQAEHYGIIADELKQNPLLAIDYLRRAYLISADRKYKTTAQGIFNKSTFDKQSEDGIKCFLTS